MIARPINIWVLVTALSLLGSLRAVGAELVQTVADPVRVKPASDEGQLAIKGFSLPDGFQVELTAAEPHLANPVAFHIDEQGRFYVVETFRHGAGVLDIRGRRDWPNQAFIDSLSPERLQALSDELLDADLASRSVDDRIAMLRYYMGDEAPSRLGVESDQIRLLEDRDGDGVVEHSSIFADGFNQLADGLASGVLARRGKVYFTNIPDLWLLEDQDGDGIAEKRDSLHYGFGVRVGFLGHDLHGLRFGPDGRLYFTIGDRGSRIQTRDGRLVGFADTGCVFRCEPDGSHLEVFAYGLRNPQELAFDAHGNLFTGDNNSDGGDQARWVYLVEGGDSGWRIGYQFINQPVARGPWNAEKLWHPQWDGQAAYLVPPIANIGNGPSGLTYHPGTGFPDAYQNTFFLVDFKGSPANSGVHTIRMKPDGATFAIDELDRVIWNILATDAEFGVEGGLYLTDWVEGWNTTGKGRLYRLFEPNSVQEKIVSQTKSLLADGMGSRSSEALGSLLDHADMRVRQEAQFELADRGPDSVQVFASILDAEEFSLAQLHAIWGLGQLLRHHGQGAQVLMKCLYSGHDEVRAQAAKVLGESPQPAAFGRLATMVASDRSSRARFFAAIALGKDGRFEAVEPLIALLQSNDDQDPYLRHAAVMGLKGLQDFRWIEALADHPSSAVRMGALLAMRRLERPEVSRFLQDDAPHLITEAARAINDVPIESAMTDLAAVEISPDLDEPALRRVVNANFRLGREEYAIRLGTLAKHAAMSDNLRAEALEALAQWAAPSGRDRVTGIWQPLSSYRSAEDARRVVQSLLGDSGSSDAPEWIGAMIQAVASLKLQAGATWLMEKVTNPAAGDRIQALALAALAELDEPALLAEAVRFGLDQGDRRLRREALKWQGESTDRFATIREVLQGDDLASQQAALASLRRETSSEALNLLGELVDQLVEGSLPSGLHLDVIEWVEDKGSASLKSKVGSFQETLKQTSPFKEFASVLVGGDPEAGRKIFLEREEVACLRCHKVGGEGGEVGPVLDGLAARQSTNYILESILYPNQVIAKGYESVLIETSDDEYYAGIIKEEEGGKLILESPEDGLITLASDQIKSREKGLSGMPEGLYLMLSKRELRDLMAFLASLK
jgi:quinoprotein glucose dehydrogenase